MRLGVFVSVSIAAAVVLVACGGPTFTATLSGANEVPPVTTSATGTVTATLDGTALSLSGSFSGLSGNPTAAHIHSGDAGSNGPVIVALNVDGGTLGLTHTLTAEQVTALTEGRVYVNVHTAANAGGEIRGQLNKQ